MAVTVTGVPDIPIGDVTRVPLSRIKPYGRNPRRRPARAVEQVAKSIREFGWQQPIVVDRDMTIIIGHTRYHAAKQLGEKTAPVIIDDRLTPDQARALRIMDNRARDYTTWDFPLLISELDELDEFFADVLDLADWQAIIGQYEAGQDDSILDVDPDTADQLGPGQHALSVTFDSRESADKAAPGILGMTGVINVTYRRS